MEYTLTKFDLGKNITTFGNGKFAPDQSISRQEMAVMLQSYSKVIGYKPPSVHKEIVFADSASISTWAKSAVKEIQMAGILMGKDGGKFDPTRAEVSSMIRRFVELVVNSETTDRVSTGCTSKMAKPSPAKRISAALPTRLTSTA